MTIQSIFLYLLVALVDRACCARLVVTRHRLDSESETHDTQEVPKYRVEAPDKQRLVQAPGKQRLDVARGSTSSARVLRYNVPSDEAKRTAVSSIAGLAFHKDHIQFERSSPELTTQGRDLLKKYLGILRDQLEDTHLSLEMKSGYKVKVLVCAHGFFLRNEHTSNQEHFKTHLLAFQQAETVDQLARSILASIKFVTFGDPHSHVGRSPLGDIEVPIVYKIYKAGGVAPTCDQADVYKVYKGNSVESRKPAKSKSQIVRCDDPNKDVLLQNKLLEAKEGLNIPALLISKSNKEFYERDDVVHWKCPLGWKVHGGDSRLMDDGTVWTRCRSTGEWTSQRPYCEAPKHPPPQTLRCDNPNKDNPIKMSMDEEEKKSALIRAFPIDKRSGARRMLDREFYERDDIVFWQCPPGWKVHGGKVSADEKSVYTRCRSTGEWTSPPPRCEAPGIQMPCGNPSKMPIDVNAILREDSKDVDIIRAFPINMSTGQKTILDQQLYKRNDIIFWRCPHGWQIRGGSLSQNGTVSGTRCRSTGEWTSPQPLCEPLPTTPSSTPPKQSKKKPPPTKPKPQSPRCENPNKLPMLDEAFLRREGEKGEIIRAFAKNVTFSSGQKPVQMFGLLDQEFYKPYDTVHWQCPPHWRMPVPSEMTQCKPIGEWTSPQPYCAPVYKCGEECETCVPVESRSSADETCASCKGKFLMQGKTCVPMIAVLAGTWRPSYSYMSQILVAATDLKDKVLHIGPAVKQAKSPWLVKHFSADDLVAHIAKCPIENPDEDLVGHPSWDNCARKSDDFSMQCDHGTCAGLYKYKHRYSSSETRNISIKIDIDADGLPPIVLVQDWPVSKSAEEATDSAWFESAPATTKRSSSWLAPATIKRSTSWFSRSGRRISSEPPEA